MTEKRRPRGLIGPSKLAPNAEPTFMDTPKKLVFGVTVKCEWCKNGRTKQRKLCGVCSGTGIRDLRDAPEPKD